MMMINDNDQLIWTIKNRLEFAANHLLFDHVMMLILQYQLYLYTINIIAV